MNNGIDVFLNISDDECILCMNYIDPHNSKRLHCHHHFCETCVLNWFETNHDCPLCHNDMAIVCWDGKSGEPNNQIVRWDGNSGKPDQQIDIDDLPLSFPYEYRSDYKSMHTLEMYAMNYNILRIMSGCGGLAYSN